MKTPDYMLQFIETLYMEALLKPNELLFLLNTVPAFEKCDYLKMFQYLMIPRLTLQ